MQLTAPNAPASKKQLWLLHILAKEDTRGWQLTMQEASDKIQELKGNGKERNTSAGGKCPDGRGYWSSKTFKVVETSDRAKYGYCTNCYADMQAFASSGYTPIHYKSHRTAKALGLWGV